ncbi:restriction endonuclease subunit S [Enterobacter mori]|jgi:type I restriction enzyme S subunit|uniref:4'-phosphopantetheinyl transferase n=4 Tax=Enterobacterales TaxID=91347 RepID=A0A9Q7NQM5_9ENTR|nr:restriction endonuclease subunit S [Enterobacter mori]MCC8233085.1 restriction endonuclease subunit S [Enterobacter mori]MCC8242468.1 restriction endonuclease subunit S [Enterobacter mori]RTQ16224.1 4'-phosphopantetheinyl transferase [Enterobacter mori]
MSEGKLPEGWVKSELDNILLTIIGGGTPSKAIPEYYQGDIPWMSVKDMNKHTLTDTIDHITNDAVENSSTNIIPAGTPIIATRMSLGKIVTASFDSAINQDLKALFLSSGVERNFFIHWYRSQAQLIESLGTGTTVKGIRLEVLKALSINLPPFFEQKNIAEKLDTLLAQVDSTKARLERIPQILKRFRQAVLEEAVSGRLTENWRDASISEKSAEELLVTISKTRKKNLTSGADSLATESKRYLAKIDAHHFNIPDVILPVGWKWTTFLQSMEKVVDCHNKTAPYTEKGIYLIRTPDIRNGIISLKNTKYVNEDTYNFWSKRCPPRSGDIIFTREAPMGEAGIVPENTRLCMGQRMMLLRPMQSYLSNKYVLLNILSISFQARMLSQAIGTGVKHLRVADVESLMYPLPPLPEQHEIVRRVEQLFAYADTIEKQVNSALTRVNNLTQSILAKAFRGELTAQWRAENPDLISGENSAAALLEKIKAERAASGGKKTSRKKA